MELSLLSRKIYLLSSEILTPVLWPLLKPLRGSATILCYHRVVPRREAPYQFRYIRDLVIEPEDFEKHLQYLLANTKVISLDQLIAALYGEGRLPSNAVVITFDDGYQDFYQYAWPLLKEYGVPATIYACNDFLDGQGRFWWYELEEILGEGNSFEISWNGKRWPVNLATPKARSQACLEFMGLFLQYSNARQEELLALVRQATGVPRRAKMPLMMTWEEVQELDQDPLITFGAHTKSHCILRVLDEPTARQEILGSKLALEQALGHPVRHLSYPYGSKNQVSEREFALARDCGFASAVTTCKGHVSLGEGGDYLYALPRLLVSGDACSLSDLKTLLSGLESLVWNVVRG